MGNPYLEVLLAGPVIGPVDAFREWLRTKPTAELAARLGVSGQTIRNWRRGRPVAVARVRQVQEAALEDGLTLTTEALIGVPSGT